MTEPVDKRAAKIIQARGFDGLSDMVATLVREEFERRGLNLPDELRETAPPFGNSNSTDKVQNLADEMDAEDVAETKAASGAPAPGGAPKPKVATVRRRKARAKKP